MGKVVFKIGDRVRPTSGPYRRTEFAVVGVEGDSSAPGVRISVESEKFRLSFPVKLLKFAPKSKRKSVMDEPKTARSSHPDTSKTPETIETSLPSPRIDAELKIGDRVAGVWDAEIIGVVQAIHPSGRVLVKWSETCKIEFFASALILLPPEAKAEGTAGHRVLDNAAGDEPAIQATPTQDCIKVGDRVYFEQYWNGDRRQFEGVVQKLNDPAGTALVDYKVPKQLQNGVESPKQLQAPIGTFALAKVPIGETTDDPLNDWGRCAEDHGLIFNVPPEAQIKQEQEPSLLGAVSPEISIAYFESEISRIQQEGYIPPVGCWIEEYTASSGSSRHVRYNSRAPSFEGKRSGGKVRKSGIGKANSPEHQQAKEAIARRNRIQALRRQIKALGEGSG